MVAITLIAVMGTSPVYDAQTEPIQEEPALTVREAQSLSEEYGFDFQADDPDHLPTRTELIASLQAIRQLATATVLETTADAGAMGASNSENRSCRHNQGPFAAIFQYLTLTLGQTQGGNPAYVNLTRHDVELRTWLVPDMWISHVEKSDRPSGISGWKATASMTIWYRFLGWTMSEERTVHCIVSP